MFYSSVEPLTVVNITVLELSTNNERCQYLVII